jgi:ABC-type methionine transport system ATPase subunit
MFVSHNMDAVQRLCTRGILLESGNVVAQGGIADVVAHYLSARDVESAPGEWVDLAGADRTGSGEARFARVRYSGDDAGRPETRTRAAGSPSRWTSTPGTPSRWSRWRP